ncbi:MAG: PLP-dependent aminotransferase family protein [bacterium]
MDYEPLFSIPATHATRSVIREILKLTQRPEVISFAGGLPAPETFPVDLLDDIISKVLQDRGQSALQYGTTEGDVRLRSEIKKWVAKDGIDAPVEQIMITNGSQQGLDLLGRVLLDPGDTVVVELPSYLGGLQAFRSYQARFEGVLQDHGGMRMDHLEGRLADLRSQGICPKFIYVVPDFQNPSGTTMDLERRVRLLELAREYDTLVVEDTPYRQLRFAGEDQPPLYSLDEDGRVITLTTFSKLFCPGFRLAWLIAPELILEKVVMAKQSTDLCTPAFNQAVMAEYMIQGRLGPQVESIKRLYQEKNALMLELMDEHMPEGVDWTRPEGGLFLWVILPEGMDSLEMLEKFAIPRDVAYVIGSAFYHDGSGRNTLRLNFSFPSKERIREGIARLGKTIRDYGASL